MCKVLWALQGPEYPVRADARLRPRSRSEIGPSGARSTGVRPRRAPVPASAGRTPTPSLHAIRLPKASCERRCPFASNFACQNSGRVEGDGSVATALMAMPEAAMHEDDGTMLRKNEVRPPVNLAGMKPEAKAARVQCPPESQLGLRVLAPYSRHHSGAGLLIHDIGHMRPGFRP